VPSIKSPEGVPDLGKPRLTAVPADATETERARARNWPPVTARRGFGMTLLGIASAGRFVTGADQPISASANELSATPVLDVLLGVVDFALEIGEVVATSVTGSIAGSTSPVFARVLDPAREPAWGLGRVLLTTLISITSPLAARGARLRAEAEAEATSAVAAVLPESMDLVMDHVDLTDQAVRRMQFEEVLAAAFEQVDMEEFMIANVDLGRIVEASMAQVNLTELALRELDLERVVTATLEQVDIFSLAREQVDPVRVAAYLRENVDVAEVLRNAPGDAVRGVFDTMGKMVPGRVQ
jgi:hypothetical protein